MDKQLKLPPAWENALLPIQTYDMDKGHSFVDASEIAHQTIQGIEKRDLWNGQAVPVYPPKDKVFGPWNSHRRSKQRWSS